MTQGMAILCMLVLHLFCRKGTDVFGTPLIWINDSTPLVYVFGFFAEICVSIYSICAGYAQYLMYKDRKLTYCSNLKRVFKLLANYWIVLCLFTAIALVRGDKSGLTVTPLNFIKNVFLLDLYNGAWWYLHTYIFLMLIPFTVLLFFPRKVNPYLGIALCVVFQICWTLADKAGALSGLYSLTNHPMFLVSYVSTEAINILRVLPAFYIGAFLCKADVVTKVNNLFQKHIPGKLQKLLILIAFVVLITVNYLIHKAILIMILSVVVFLLFNIWPKSKYTVLVFLFLGKHSTNIWLCHMFFYINVFPNLVFVAKYSLPMLLFMLLLCIVTSYIVMSILSIIELLLKRTNRGEK